MDAVNQAVEEAAYTHTGLPDKIPQGCGMVTFEYQNTLEYANYNPVVIFMDAGELDELESYYAGEETDWILLIASEDGWKVQEGQISRETADACAFDIKEGDVLELETDSMVQALEEW